MVAMSGTVNAGAAVWAATLPASPSARLAVIKRSFMVICCSSNPGLIVANEKFSSTVTAVVGQALNHASRIFPAGVFVATFGQSGEVSMRASPRAAMMKFFERPAYACFAD
jgi:hypothetical protein